MYRLDYRHSGTPPGINSSRNPVQQMIRLKGGILLTGYRVSALASCVALPTTHPTRGYRGPCSRARYDKQFLYVHVSVHLFRATSVLVLYRCNTFHIRILEFEFLLTCTNQRWQICLKQAFFSPFLLTDACD